MADLSRIIRALRGNTIQLSLRDLLIDEQASGCESYGNGADAMVATSVMKAVFNTAVCDTKFGVIVKAYISIAG